MTNPMLVFANPIEAVPNPINPAVLTVPPGLSVPAGATVPQLGGGQNTLYFGPGIYDLGLTPVTVNSDEQVYFAGGAYVKGFFAFAPGATGAAIRGRGILSGEDLPKAQCIGTAAGCPDMVVARGNPQSLVVEGITFIQSPYYNISLNSGTGNRVDNVKVIAWLGNSDGIQASYGAQDTGSVIENSFVKNGDDSIKITASNLLVRNCVVWKMNNGAAFQMGAGIADNLTNITVRDSDVIRTEYDYPTTSSAVFAANQGGKGNLTHYLFEDIRVENASWQVFKVEILPSNFEPDNYQLGSISDLHFQDILVMEAPQFPAIFRGYDLAHRVSGVEFQNVQIDGVSMPSPTPDLDANRNASYAGNTISDLLFRNRSNPTEFGIPLFTLSAPAGVSQYSIFSITQPALTSDFAVRGSGDFFGDGYASAVLLDTAHGTVGLWKEPYRNSAQPWSAQYSAVYTLPSADSTVAGTGDFNGDGYSDILLWDGVAQTGQVLFTQGDQVMGQTTFQPAAASTWSVAGVADFRGDGYSDVLLRDESGNVEMAYFDGSAQPTFEYFAVSTLGYTATANYMTSYGSATGHFDASWTVAGRGILQTLGTLYASIVWVNQATGQLGITQFTPFLQTPEHGEVFAKLPADTAIEAVGDFNGDGAKDLLLWNASTAENAIWFLNFDSGVYYEVGPTLQPSLPAGWQVTGG